MKISLQQHKTLSLPSTDVSIWMGWLIITRPLLFLLLLLCMNILANDTFFHVFFITTLSLNDELSWKSYLQFWSFVSILLLPKHKTSVTLSSLVYLKFVHSDVFLVSLFIINTCKLWVLQHYEFLLRCVINWGKEGK